jgi:hypothetical protein
MTDTKWADVSRWQCAVNDSYPHPFFSFKCSDGNDVDPNNSANLSWSKANAGKQLVGFAGYHVYRVGEDNLGGVKRALGSPHPYMTIMLDVEDWEGEIHGNQSGPLNELREQLIVWLGGSRSRVFGYANTGNGNMQELWPQHNDTKFIIPNYSGKPSHADMIGHQYADDVNCAPFGPCDANIAYGKTPAQWATTLGITGASSDDMPKQIYLYNKSGQTTKLPKAGTWYTVGWDEALANTGGSSLSLPKGAGLFSMSAWLYTTGLTNDDNLYWRVQTLKGADNTELAKFPVAEIRGTTGESDLQFKQDGSVSSGTQTNLRILVSATKDNVAIKSAWWRCLYW